MRTAVEPPPPGAVLPPAVPAGEPTVAGWLHSDRLGVLAVLQAASTATPDSSAMSDINPLFRTSLQAMPHGMGASRGPDPA